MMDISDAVGLATEELIKATRKFGPFASAHEGYAIILEEVDELWEEVKRQHDDPKRHANMRTEATQIAAMAIRFLMDCCEIDYETLGRY
jgi:hypothetical protein